MSSRDAVTLQEVLRSCYRRAHTGNVSGMLLYARTTEEIEPWLSVPIGGNQISVRSLDLNRPFVEIADSLDRIVYENFGDTLKRIA